MSSSPAPEDPEEVLTLLAAEVRSLLPEDCREFTAMVLGLFDNEHARYRIDGEWMPVPETPYFSNAAKKLVRRLRAATYEPGRGAWYTLSLRFTADGGHSVTYNHEAKPKARIADAEYARDLGYFPRDREHVPDWLADIMGQADNVYGAVHADSHYEPPNPHVIARVFRESGWTTEMDEESTEYTYSSEWARFRTMHVYPMVRFAGRADLSRIAELEQVLAKLDWESGGEIYDDLGQEIRQLEIKRG